MIIIAVWSWIGRGVGRGVGREDERRNVHGNEHGNVHGNVHGDEHGNVRRYGHVQSRKTNQKAVIERSRNAAAPLSSAMPSDANTPKTPPADAV